MPFYVIRQDLTKMNVDIIVNPAQPEPFVGGTTDYLIHQVAGKGLIEERKRFGLLKTTDAVITSAYKLNASYVIHTVGPIYQDGKHNERALLEVTYLNCLKLAVRHRASSIAFPLISSGHYGYPKDEAIEVAD